MAAVGIRNDALGRASGNLAKWFGKKVAKVVVEDYNFHNLVVSHKSAVDHSDFNFNFKLKKIELTKLHPCFNVPSPRKQTHFTQAEKRSRVLRPPCARIALLEKS